METERASGPAFLRRTVLVALVTGVGIGLLVALRWGWGAASGFVVALLWSLANFGALGAILREITRPGGSRKGFLISLVILKLVGLYGLAAVLLWKRWFPVTAFLAGFSWPLAVVLLRSVAGIWWGKTETA